jgi:SAM-dependent methyltransferase
MTAGDVPSERERHRAVAKFFSENAASWRDRYATQSFDAHQYQTRAEIAMSWLGSPATPARRRLLEIGSGAGVQAALAARQGWDVMAVDLSPVMLQQAAQQIRGPRWIAAAAEALPVRPGTFDVVLMLGVIGYVVDPSRTLECVRALLRPGGRLIVAWRTERPPLLERVGSSVSAVPQWLYLGLKRAIGGRLDPVGYGGGFYDVFDRCWPPEDFLRLLERAGFGVVHVRGHNFGVFRFVGKALWPESVDVRLTRVLERAVRYPPFRATLPRTRCYVALATPAGQ